MALTRSVVVVGAGIAGTASAYYLHQAGFTVALFDTHHPGWGASGRNPGFLWLQTKAAGLAMDFSLAGRRFAEALAYDLPDFCFRASGGLITYRDDVFEPVGSDDDRPTVAGQAMACSIMGGNFPSMSRLPIVRQWAGVVAQTSDGLPVIDCGSGPDGLILNTGHFFGNLAGAFSGKIVAHVAARRAPAYPVDGFSLKRFVGASTQPNLPR